MYKTQSCAIVKLYLRGLEQEETVSIFTVTSPAICSPLPEIDVLNFYWSIVTGEVVKEERGLVAVNRVAFIRAH